MAMLLVAALSASAETALTSISRIKLRRLVEEGSRRAAIIERLHREPNDYLTAVLTTNTIAIVLSSTAASLIAENHGIHGFLPELAISIIDAVVVLVVAEVTAKTLALSNIRYALWVAPAVSFVTAILRWPVRVMSGVARVISRGRDVRGPFVTEEELKLLVTVGEQEGIIEEEEREMIHGIIELGDMTVREVMIPRIDIVAVEVQSPVSEIVAQILKHGHTRIPVYEDTIDHIVGVAYAKDLLRYNLQAKGDAASDLRKLLRKPYFVPEGKNLSEFLHEMRQNRVHMACVIDEHGQTAGLVTIEDVIEEIVGPIRDEYDAMEEEEIQFLAPNEAVIDARVSLNDAREELGLELPADDVDSLGGFIYARVGTIPKTGEVIELGDSAVMTVVSVRGQRIGKVRVRSEQPFPGALTREETRAAAEARRAAVEGEGGEPDAAAAHR
ncbi:MAG: magnesium and cobalt exporter, family [Chloroflexota bacterium]|jgi:CBS domain containing-hemolysin-like protein|nr:magnesium and cobalt exporter, family [Chloroflexota bacterium]